MNTSHALPFSRRSILRVAAILVIGYALTALAIQLWAQGFTSEIVRSDNREVTVAGRGLLYNGMIAGFAASSDPSVFSSMESAGVPEVGLSAGKIVKSQTDLIPRTHPSPRRSIKGFFSHLPYSD